MDLDVLKRQEHSLYLTCTKRSPEQILTLLRQKTLLFLSSLAPFLITHVLLAKISEGCAMMHSCCWTRNLKPSPLDQVNAASNMQSRARICLGLQPNKWILEKLASHFHTNIALCSLLIQSEIVGKSRGKQTPGSYAKFFPCIVIYALILPKSLTRGAQAVQWTVAPRCDTEVLGRAPTTASQVLQVEV